MSFDYEQQAFEIEHIQTPHACASKANQLKLLTFIKWHSCCELSSKAA